MTPSVRTRTMPPMTQPAHGRLPHPPRGALWPAWAALSATFAVGAAAGLYDVLRQERTPAFDEYHPLLILGSGIAALALFVLVVFLLAHRKAWRPGGELAWCPIHPAVPQRLTFNASGPSVHGIWLNVDIQYDFGASSFEVVTFVRAWAGGRMLTDGRMGLRWGRNLHTQAVTVPPQDVINDVGAVALVLDRRMETVPGAAHSGRYRGLVLVCELPDLAPGETVVVDLLVEPPSFPCTLRAEGFIATPS